MTEKINKEKFKKITKAEFSTYKQLSNFFMITADLLCIAGFDGYFKKINPAVSKLLGYTEEELMARPINDFVFHEDKETTIDSRNFVYDGRSLLNFENRYQTKSGEVVWLSWTSIPDVEAGLVFAIAKNITSKKLAEEERSIFISELTKINDDLKKFSQMTSHDMRSPLNNLLAISNLLNGSEISDPKAVELVKLLKLTSENLHQTVNNFVDVMIKNEKLAVTLETLDLTTVLAKVTTTISSLIEGAKAKINIDFSAFEEVRFNKAYLESIFLNLISNSIKYAHPDRDLIINISSQIEGGTKQLRINDNALGFDMKKVKNKIFKVHQVFHQHIDSKGLGLHLVHQHVTTLGGQIEVESKVNEGTTFIICFKEESF